MDDKIWRRQLGQLQQDLTRLRNRLDTMTLCVVYEVDAQAAARGWRAAFLCGAGEVSLQADSSDPQAVCKLDAQTIDASAGIYRTRLAGGKHELYWRAEQGATLRLSAKALEKL